jgi:thiamine biosynthesis lipoprotein
MKKLLFCASLILAVSALFVGCNSSKPYRTAQGVVWNTTFHITYASNVALDDSIHQVFRQVDMSLSTFNDSSLVSRINRCETTMTDSLFRRTFLESQRISQLSNGDFDPTVAPLVNLWGFGTNKDETNSPTQAQIDSALRHVGIRECHLNSDGTLTKKDSLTIFNFSAIAKGYGVDLIGQMLKRNGVNDFIVEIGGEVAVHGKSPRGGKWRVMIDAPIQNDSTVVHSNMAIIEIDSCGLATSGNYRNYHVLDDKVVGHTINPFTGKPANSSILSATIIAPECITADALATACMVMPLDSAKVFIEKQQGVSALFVTADSLGKWQLHPTANFPSLTH